MGEETEIIAKSGLNKDLLAMIVRKVFTLLSGYLVGRGLLDENSITSPMIDTVVGAVCIIISLIWSNKNRKKLANEIDKNKPA